MAHLSKRDSLQDHLPEYGVWIIVTIIAALIVIFAVAAALVILVLKCRQQQQFYTQVRHIDSQPSTAPLLKKKTSNMSVNDVLDPADEDQRSYIIRKSLAGRRASNASRVEPATYRDQKERGGRNNDSGNQIYNIDKGGSLVKDWKEFEAGLRRDKSRSPRRHPSLMTLAHPPPARRAAEPFIRDGRLLSSTEEVIEDEEEHINGSQGCNAEPQMQGEWVGQRQPLFR